MPANRTKLILIASVFLICIFGCLAIAEVAQENSEGQAPIRRVQITIDEGQREHLFAQLQGFSDKYSFEFVIRKAGPNGEGFLIRMLRDDVHIVAIISRVDPKIVSVGFYDKDPAHPTPKGRVDELLNDLKSFVSEIPNTTITEEK